MYELAPLIGASATTLRDTFGKGILLKNVSQDKTLSYGLVEDISEQPSRPPFMDVTALCQDPNRLSMLFYTKVVGI